MRKLALVSTFCLATLVVPSAARSQGSYPIKPVRIVVTAPPGAGFDSVARKLASRLEVTLRQAVIVDNRPGASGTIGVDYVAKSPADGYAMVLAAGSTMTVIPHVLKKMPYDPLKDLSPVAQVATTQVVLLVNASNLAKSLNEFLAATRAHPKSVSFGSYGSASLGHLLGESLNRAASLDMIHVAYKGGAPAVIDLLGGQIDAVFADLASAAPHLHPGGKLRALALTGPSRNAAYPQVPTFTELGYPTLEPMYGWIGVFVPAATPPDVVSLLSAEISRALKTEEVRKSLADLGYQATGSSPKDLADLVRLDTTRWGKVIQSIGGLSLD